MWKNESRHRYFWAAIGPDMDRFIQQLMDIEEDEETDLYRFRLCLGDERELAIFSRAEKKKILGLFGVLMKDTKRHLRMVARIRKLLENYRSTHDANRIRKS